MDAPELRFQSASVEETEAFAAGLAERLPPGAVLALVGELGAGKTAFVRGLGRGLDVADEVHSPTYTLMHEYAGRVPLLHFDAWMEGRERAYLAGGGAEWLRTGGIAAIEWADRVEAFLPRPRLEVALWHRGADERAIEVRIVPADGPAGRELEGELRRALRGLEERSERSEPRGAPDVPPGARP